MKPFRILSVLSVFSMLAGVLPAQQAIAPGAKKVNPKDGLSYVRIPPGKFTMGCATTEAECGADEGPAHPVTITKGFWLGEMAVTQRAYEKVTGQNPSTHKGPDLPVEHVNWNEAKAYCTAIGGRLPTEAEWEYAARAGTTGPRYGKLDEIAWHSGNSGNESHPGGQKLPNAFGLYDMLGGAWQWVADWYGPYSPEAQTDPTGPADGKMKLPRGGSWGSNAKMARAPHRDTVEPEHRGPKLGIRCVGPEL